VIVRPVLLRGVRKPEVISSPFHSNYLKSFAGCWWARRPGEINGSNRVRQVGDRNQIRWGNVAGDGRTSVSTAAWPTDAKRITAIIDFIILAVNLVNPAIASLYFRLGPSIAVSEKPFLCATCFNLKIWGNWQIYELLN
jgi:hypothetical protein